MTAERESEPEDRPRSEDVVGEAAPTPPSTVIENPAEASAEDHRVARLLQHTIDLPILASAVEAQDPADAADTLETLDAFAFTRDEHWRDEDRQGRVYYLLCTVKGDAEPEHAGPGQMPAVETGQLSSVEAR